MELKTVVDRPGRIVRIGLRPFREGSNDPTPRVYIEVLSPARKAGGWQQRGFTFSVQEWDDVVDGIDVLLDRELPPPEKEDPDESRRGS